MSTYGLAVYLNDHLAGAAAGVALLASLAERPSISGPAKALHDEVLDDKRELERLMERLGVAKSAVRQGAGWLSEKLAELKTRVDDPSGGTLHEFELLEAISLGVHGKRSLWTTLKTASASAAALDGVDFDRLITRADDQRARLETLRLAAAQRALA
jgi:hypothetical protein